MTGGGEQHLLELAEGQFANDLIFVMAGSPPTAFLLIIAHVDAEVVPPEIDDHFLKPTIAFDGPGHHEAGKNVFHALVHPRTAAFFRGMLAHLDDAGFVRPGKFRGDFFFEMAIFNRVRGHLLFDPAFDSLFLQNVVHFAWPGAKRKTVEHVSDFFAIG